MGLGRLTDGWRNNGKLRFLCLRPHQHDGEADPRDDEGKEGGACAATYLAEKPKLPRLSGSGLYCAAGHRTTRPQLSRPVHLGEVTAAMALKGSSEGRSHPRRGVEEPLPSTDTLKSERSLAFKQWAQGRCYRCLARDHRVSSCQDLFRCICCRRPGHRERHCPHRFPSPTQHTPSPTANPRHPQPTRSWAHIVVASSPNQLCTQPSPPQSPSPLRGEDLHARCDRAPQASAIFDLQSILTPLLQSLHSELQQHIITHLENLVRPLR